jgi:hypothetical protein
MVHTSGLSKDAVKLVVVVYERVVDYTLLPELATECLRVGVPRILSQDLSASIVPPRTPGLTEME